MAGERGKIFYGAVAFWIVVAGLLTARVLLLDMDKVRAGHVLTEATATSTVGMLGTHHNQNF
jgi:hypothetical protein